MVYEGVSRDMDLAWFFISGILACELIVSLVLLGCRTMYHTALLHIR